MLKYHGGGGLKFWPGDPGGGGGATGGGGRDVLTGGSGADMFIYKNVSDSWSGNSQDVIKDFNSAEGDRLVLSGLNGFTSDYAFIGSSAFTGSRVEARFIDSTLEVNGLTGLGDKVAEMSIKLEGVSSFNKDWIV